LSQAALLHGDEAGRTPFHIVAEKGNEEILNVLISHLPGDDDDDNDDDKVEILKKLFDKQGRTPLHLACAAGSVRAVRKLVGLGDADKNRGTNIPSGPGQQYAVRKPEGERSKSSRSVKKPEARFKNTLDDDSDAEHCFYIVTTYRQVQGNFFGPLRLSWHKELFRKPRVITAMAVVCFICLNVYTIVTDFVKSLTGGSSIEPNAMLSTERMIFDHLFLTPDRLVSYAEIFGLCVFFSRIGYRLYSASRKAKPNSMTAVLPSPDAASDAASYMRWRSIGILFHEILPGLQVYSAMKLLKYMVPALIVRDTSRLAAKGHELLEDKKYVAFVWQLFLFTFKHVGCVVLGFEAFLLKFRKAHVSLVECSQTGNDLVALVTIVAFLNQMLGVVNVSTFAINRLHAFIFGGVDHIINDDEERRRHVWQAAFHKLAWKACGGSWSNPRIVHYLALALTFSDFDFQRLVLDDDNNGGLGKADVVQPPPPGQQQLSVV